jgi:hypothetical protein
MGHSSFGFPCDDFGATNPTGVFRKKFRKVYFYFIAIPGSLIEQPYGDLEFNRDEVSDEATQPMYNALAEVIDE